MFASRSQPGPPRTRQRQAGRRSPRRRILFAAVYLLWLGLLGIGGIKLFWWLQYGQLSQTEPSQDVVWRHYYREVYTGDIAHASPSLNDNRMDILLLGGSVMEQTGPYFRKYFAAHSGLNATVCMVARAAHNSRDSALKYTRIADRPFDYVLVYNGINDVPMNYFPESKFDLEYRHCGWFFSLERRLKAGRINLKDAFRDTVVRYAVRARPDDDMLPFGAVIKTPPALVRNLGQIVDLARQTGSVPVLMTFGYYIEPGYDRETFLSGAYGYGEGPFGMPVEDWGLPEHIPPIMDAQNEAIRQLAARKQVLLIDQAKLITGRDNYCDVCHLSYSGCELFVQNVMAALNTGHPPDAPQPDSTAGADDRPALPPDSPGNSQN